jgi:hypothetical protein
MHTLGTRLVHFISIAHLLEDSHNITFILLQITPDNLFYGNCSGPDNNLCVMPICVTLSLAALSFSNIRIMSEKQLLHPRRMQNATMLDFIRKKKSPFSQG